MTPHTQTTPGGAMTISHYTRQVEEFNFLWTRHAGAMSALRKSILRNGIREPILLGSDGRVWDGHHRLAVADGIGMGNVPVEWQSTLVSGRVPEPTRRFPGRLGGRTVPPPCTRHSGSSGGREMSRRFTSWRPDVERNHAVLDALPARAVIIDAHGAAWQCGGEPAEAAR